MSNFTYFFKHKLSKSINTLLLETICQTDVLDNFNGIYKREIHRFSLIYGFPCKCE